MLDTDKLQYNSRLNVLDLHSCSHSVLKWHVVIQMLVMVDYVRETTSKKSCKYGEYGSFEHFKGSQPEWCISTIYHA